jgi:hypothetical protein
MERTAQLSSRALGVEFISKSQYVWRRSSSDDAAQIHTMRIMSLDLLKVTLDNVARRNLSIVEKLLQVDSSSNQRVERGRHYRCIEGTGYQGFLIDKELICGRLV